MVCARAQGEEKACIDSGASVMIQDTKWSYTGALLATSSKDKNIRLCDPRTGGITTTTKGHEGSKTSKLCWLDAREKLVSVGFTRQSKRQIKARVCAQPLPMDGL